MCLPSWEHAWEHTAKYTGSVLSSAIGNVLKSMLGSVLESVSEGHLGVSRELTWEHSPAGWECVINCNWEYTWECTPECAWVCLKSTLWSLYSGRLGVCYRVQLGASLSTCSGDCLRTSWDHTCEPIVLQAGSATPSAIGSILESMSGSVLGNVCGGVLGSILRVYSAASWELTWDCKSSRLGGVIMNNWACTVKQAGSVPWSTIGSVLECIPRSVLENVLGGIHESICRVYLEVSWELTWQCKLSRLWVCSHVWSGVYYRAYLAACIKVNLAACFQVGCVQCDVQYPAYKIAYISS